MAKIKRTEKGNIQITITEEQATAVRDLFGYTSFSGRKDMVKSYDSNWTIEMDDSYRVVYDLIDDFKG